jgi:hypothetical protein
MQKITAILAEAGDIVGVAGPQTAADLNRIANALERIASSLEKLTGEPKNNPVITPPQSPENKVIQLESKNAQVKAPVLVKAITPATTNAVKPGIIEKVQLQTISSQDSVLDKYLKKKEIAVLAQKKQAFTPEKDEILDKLALHLGKNFTECKKLYLSLKANSTNDSISYSLYGATAKENTKIRKFCSLLEGVNLLEDFEYLGSPVFSLQFKPINITNHYKNFIDGKWLERFLKQEVQRIIPLLSPKLEHEVRSNLHIQFKNSPASETNSPSTELDLLFSAGQHIFCIEAKTKARISNLESHLNKINPLGLPKQNILIVAAENSMEEHQELSQALNGINVVGLSNFEEALTTMIKAACEPSPQKKPLG